MTDSSWRHKRLLEQLAASGDLTPAWQEAFATVRRHQFIPETIWDEHDDHLVPLRRDDDPQGWLDSAYAMEAVITQVDDGHPAGPGQVGRYITSSASRPNIVARMLSALCGEPGERVLEIGTGTGYNAALLAHRLGAENITSIEIDPHIVDHARRALAVAGYPVTVVSADGSHGYPPRAPYDRIIATASVQQVPYPWVEQTRPGGTILTPWGTPYHNGALVSLTVTDHGTAEGCVVGNVSFMRLRDQRFLATINDEECDETAARRSHTVLEPYNVAGDYDASLAIGMRVPNCTNIYVPADDQSADSRLWFIDPTTDSWANLVHRSDVGEYLIHQSGPRSLWDEIETAYHWWRDAGSPGAARWSITVTPDGQHVALADAPASTP